MTAKPDSTSAQRTAMLQKWFTPRPTKVAGRALFQGLAVQARQPGLYAHALAPDTVEGRFELYVLHLVVLLRRLKGQGPQAAETAQATFDTFLKNLEEGLREMGVGDLSVGKKMRKLGEAVYGRIKSYDAALDALPDRRELQAVVSRTVYADAAPPPGDAIADYAAGMSAALAAQPLSDILEARVHWPAFTPA